MATGQTITASLTALLLGFVFCAPLPPASANAPQLAKGRRGADNDPLIDAQLQIARLRQTAGQLRLLANQSVPGSLPGAARAELVEHERWLRQAEQRVSVLASEWEDQLRPLNDRNALGSANDLNAFFSAQSERLKAKLQQESLAQRAKSERVRSSGATARLVIGNMH